MKNVTFSTTKFQGQPAIVLSVDGQYREQAFLFYEARSVDCATEMLETFCNLIEESEIVTTEDNEQGVVLTSARGYYLFRFAEGDRGTASYLMHIYCALIANNDEDAENLDE